MIKLFLFFLNSGHCNFDKPIEIFFVSLSFTLTKQFTIYEAKLQYSTPDTSYDAVSTPPGALGEASRSLTPDALLLRIFPDGVYFI